MTFEEWFADEHPVDLYTPLEIDAFRQAWIAGANSMLGKWQATGFELNKRLRLEYQTRIENCKCGGAF